MDWIQRFFELNWDYLVFVAIIITLYGSMEYGLRRYWLATTFNRVIRLAPLFMACLVVIILCMGWILKESASQREYERTKQILSGNAPTLAYELQRLGHKDVRLGTAADSPIYTNIVDTMLKWLQLNPQIESMYTLRKVNQATNIFIIRPETDYNGNGKIDSGNEERIPIGEVYEAAIPELEQAFAGQVAFQSKVDVDKWGASLSTFVPIYDSEGKQEAVFGVDFNGEAFIKNIAIARLSVLGFLLIGFILFYMLYGFILYVSVERVYRRHEGELKFQAYHDALTGLPNMLQFSEKLTEALEEARETNGLVAVMFMDLDRFKNVNEGLGHSLGDLLLQAVAERLSSCFSQREMVARLGGDEYAFLLPNAASIQEIEEKAQHVQQAFTEPINIMEYELYLTFSIGISVYPSGGDNVDSLIRNADTAMYYAKERASQYHLYTEDMNEDMLERLSMESQLRKAIERDELILYYQPKIHGQSGKMVGLEALVRWRHPENGLIPPGKFIPIAEDTGLIVQVGEWVLRAACLQMRTWSKMGLEPVKVSINISTRQFQQKDLFYRIKHIIEETEIDPTYLELEITESCIMQYPESSNRTLHQLKELGLQISLDDFGTGYSSLNYLRNFPLDNLKIDKGFIQEVTQHNANAAIVTTVITLAHTLGLKVIAEGVETEEQLHFLTGQACDEVQGYFYSPPLPPEEFINWHQQYKNKVELA